MLGPVSTDEGIAVRTRTVVAGSRDVRLLGADSPLLRHAVDANGTLYFVPPPGSPLTAALVAPALASPAVTLICYDVAPVPMPDRLRATVTLVGRVRAHRGEGPSRLVQFLGVDAGTPSRPKRWPVVAFQPDRACLTLHSEIPSGTSPVSFPVDLDGYRSAPVDPFIEYEREWLPHMQLDHAEAVRHLHAAARPGAVADSVAPLLLDRNGLVLRATGEHGVDDVRLDFGRAVGCACEAKEELNGLLARAVEARRS